MVILDIGPCRQRGREHMGPFGNDASLFELAGDETEG
jgi:hypothetical protein